jgi:Flp pilus assembly protein TadD
MRTTVMMRLGTFVVAVSLVAAITLSADTRWARVTTPHFVVSGDAPAAELERFAATLETLRGAFTEVLPRVGDNSLLPAFAVVFGSETTFSPYQPPGVTVGGYSVLEPFAPCMVMRSARSGEAFRTVVHEYVHVLFDAPWMPPWLSEGVADYFSTTAVRRDGRRAVMGEKLAAHVNQATRWWIPLSDVVSRPASARLSNTEGGESFYAESWLLVHYLIRATPEKGTQLGRFMELLASGVSAGTAFEQAIGPPVRIDAHLQRYLSNGVIYGEERTLSKPIGKVVAEARPMTAAEVDATLGRLEFHLRHDDRAMARLQASIAADPTLPEAAVTLGMMHVRQGRRSDAVPHFRRAIAAEPSNLLAAYHLGSMALDRSRVAGAPSLEEAHAALARAVADRPATSPQVLTTLGTLAGRVGRLDEAEPLLRRVVAAEPDDPTARLELANVGMRLGKFDEARRALDSIAADPKSFDTRAAKLCLDWLPVAQARAEVRAELAAIAGLPSAGLDSGISRTGFFPPAPRPRTPGAGEERRLALLDAVECGDKAFVIRVSTRSGSLRLTTTALGKVHLSSAREDVTGSLPCGPRPAREAVYVTWAGDHQLVALEFLPSDLQPAP